MNSIQTISTITNAANAGLQEWLECQDFILAMKGSNRCWDSVELQSLPHFQLEIKPIVTQPKRANETIERQLAPYCYQHFDLIERALEIADEVAQQIPTALAQLNAATLGEKRQVLRYMQIIPPAVSALFLGTTEDTVNELKCSNKPYYAQFGNGYAGSHSFSMAELDLIADNTVAINASEAISLKKTRTRYDDTVLDHVTLVDEETAIAFTNLSSDELRAAVPRTYHTRRPYRLADLEEIRVAKLKKLAH